MERCAPIRRTRRFDPTVDVAVLRYLRSSDDGILVTTRPGMNLLSARMAPRRLVKVAQDHMNFGSYKPALQASIVRHYPKLDALTVLTEQDRQGYARALNGSGLRMERIPNGVPRPILPPAALDAKVIVAAGRLSSHKGFDMLIDAFRIVSGKHPDWQLWMFGSGAWKKKLTKQIEARGLTGKAHLKGTTKRLDEQFAAASVFVLSSRFEGLPMVLLESMAAGLPAVAFDCPTGPREVIEPGRTGLLVPAEDVPALAAGLCELIEDPARRRAMGEAALRSAAAYSIDAVKVSWERLYEEVVRARQLSAGRRG
jgi:glycosyltransferase involved in cell wall biosynthesis